MSNDKHSSSYHSIGAIGPKDIISGFQALGADIFPVHSKKELRELADQFKKEGAHKKYAVLLITASMVENATDAREMFSFKESLPTTVIIPDVSVKDSGNNEYLKELTKRAIGFDIIKE